MGRPADALDPSVIAALLIRGYRFEVFTEPDHVDIVRPDSSIAFRIRREGSPPDAYAALIEQLRTIHRETTDA